MEDDCIVDILVLGGNGMLGHKVFQYLRPRIPDTWCTVRDRLDSHRLRALPLFQDGNVIDSLDAMDVSALETMLSRHKPGVIINCIGIVKRRPEASAPLLSITLNALLPHRLAAICSLWGGRLIHISTDCVFSGHRGNYSEADETDATDLYGRTKALGEITGSNCLTLRTSIIGRELERSESLLEWFLGQNGQCVRGFARAMYSGVTTPYLAEVLERVVSNFPALNGLYHVTAPPISKLDLLRLLKPAFNLAVEIVPDDEFVCDRTMQGEAFRRATGLSCPSWTNLITGLASDTTPYKEWRANNHDAI